ncbi:Gp37-like protein [Spirillospora sp. CA-294931]|uniref:Gp37-like protein n=1 Tax=Spirillospora sp. CA-294931 TaxID=3240042 RepID=UPI003D8F5C48
MAAAHFRVFVWDKPAPDTNRMPLLGEVDVYTNFEAIIRLNAVGAWTMTMPTGADQATLVRPGRGVVVYRPDEHTWPVFSGPIRRIERSWSADDSGSDLMVSGPCDNAILKERVGRASPRWPLIREGIGVNASNPALDWVPLITDASGVTRAPGNSAEFIWSVLRENYALPVQNSREQDQSRRVRHFRVGGNVPAYLSEYPADSLWKGYPIRMADLATTLFELADAAGYRIQCRWQPMPTPGQTPGNPVEGIFLNITQITDRSERIVLDPAAGNLSSYTLVAAAPEATRVIMGGETTASDRRYYRSRKNDLWDPPHWKDWDDKDAVGNRLYEHQWSDPYGGRQAIETEWNVTAEALVDVREAEWPYQPDTIHRGDALAPAPGAGVDVQFDNEGFRQLVELGPTGSFTLEAVDTPDTAFGTHYDVGDVVRAVLDTRFLPPSMTDIDGTLREQVREVKLATSADALWTVSPTIGAGDATQTPYIYREMRRLRHRVEHASAREETNALSRNRPDAPRLYLATSNWDGEGVYATTRRPIVGQAFQLRITIPSDPESPRYVAASQAQPDLEWSTNGTDWNTVSSSSIKVSSKTTNGWFYVTSIGTLNLARYWRARVTRSGSVGPWSDDVVKIQAAEHFVMENGTITLHTPPQTYRQYTRIRLTGIDTTYGDLEVQYLQDGTWRSYETVPHFNYTAYSIPFEVPLDSTFSLRVVSRSAYPSGPIVKTSNVVTVSVTP